MDFLLPKQRTVIEMKLVRDRNHGEKIGDELIIDIEHYRKHPVCDSLWCVVYDPDHLLTNGPGLHDPRLPTLEGRTLPKPHRHGSTDLLPAHFRVGCVLSGKGLERQQFFFNELIQEPSLAIDVARFGFQAAECFQLFQVEAQLEEYVPTGGS